MSAIRPGVETSEFKMAKSSGIWSAVMIVVGLVAAIAACLVDIPNLPPVVSTVAGAAVTISGIITKAWTSIHYNHGRALVKSAAEGGY